VWSHGQFGCDIQSSEMTLGFLMLIDASIRKASSRCSRSFSVWCRKTDYIVLLVFRKFTWLKSSETGFVDSACSLCFLFVGIFFVLPCIESYTKVDLRTVSFDVPPQEVSPSAYHVHKTVINCSVFG